eukprot:6176310-Pleurochrysis_carterae.AAC.2
MQTVYPVCSRIPILAVEEQDPSRVRQPSVCRRVQVRRGARARLGCGSTLRAKHLHQHLTLLRRERYKKAVYVLRMSCNRGNALICGARRETSEEGGGKRHRTRERLLCVSEGRREQAQASRHASTYASTPKHTRASVHTGTRAFPLTHAEDDAVHGMLRDGHLVFNTHTKICNGRVNA